MTEEELEKVEAKPRRMSLGEYLLQVRRWKAST